MQLSEFRDLLANDGFAATFQKMGQYRTELLRALDKLSAQADARPVGHFFKASRVHPWVQVEKECPNAVPLYTHPEASAPGLSGVLQSLDDECSSLDLGDYARGFKACIDKLKALTRASAATVAEPKVAERMALLDNVCRYADSICGMLREGGWSGKAEALEARIKAVVDFDADQRT